MPPVRLRRLVPALLALPHAAGVEHDAVAVVAPLALNAERLATLEEVGEIHHDSAPS